MLVACRDNDPVAWVTADAQVHFDCDEIEVRYAGAYESTSDDRHIELYEAVAACGGVATYRCETFDDGASSSSSCCRFGEGGAC